MLLVVIFLLISHPRSLFHLFFRFFQTDIAILQEKLWENVHPVYNAKIRTHHIQHASIIVKPIDPGTRKILLNQR